MKGLECAAQSAELVNLLNQRPETDSAALWHRVEERTRAFAVSQHLVLIGKVVVEASAK